VDWQTQQPSKPAGDGHTREHQPATALSKPRSRASRELRVLLASILEHELIPKMTHGVKPTASSAVAGGVHAEPASRIGLDQVRYVAEASLHPDPDRLASHIGKLRLAGLSLESLYLDLLTPAARELGARWENDTCDFVLVTLGLLRIQQIMCEYSPEFLQEGAPPTGRRIFVAPLPGSHHTLGAVMVSDFFRRAGWGVECALDGSKPQIVKSVRREWFDAIALSISLVNQINTLTSLVSEIRKASLNRGILVLVGGAVAHSVPDLAARVGADVVTLDAKEAVEFAEQAVPAKVAPLIG